MPHLDRKHYSQVEQRPEEWVTRPFHPQIPIDSFFCVSQEDYLLLCCGERNWHWQLRGRVLRLVAGGWLSLLLEGTSSWNLPHDTLALSVDRGDRLDFGCHTKN